MNLAAIKSRLRNRSREVSTRKQVGDTVSMMNDEPYAVEESKQDI